MQSVFNSITFLVIIACNLMIWLSSRGKMQHQSQKKSRELRNQVGRVLIAQATLNLLLILLPALIAVLAMNIFKDVFTRWLQLLIFQVIPMNKRHKNGFNRLGPQHSPHSVQFSSLDHIDAHWSTCCHANGPELLRTKESRI